LRSLISATAVALLVVIPEGDLLLFFNLPHRSKNPENILQKVGVFFDSQNCASTHHNSPSIHHKFTTIYHHKNTIKLKNPLQKRPSATKTFF
jgi:hypothetical protein